MSIIPDPREAQQLRALYAGNPVIDALERLYREHGGLDESPHVRDVLALLDAGAGQLDASPLTERERRAVLARFTPEPAERCRCGALIEYVTEGPDPGWWRHTEVATTEQPCPAVPDHSTARNRTVERTGQKCPAVPDHSAPGASVDPERRYLDAKQAAERRYAEALGATTFMRGGNEVREKALKAAGKRLTADLRAAWDEWCAADIEHGNSGPGGAL